MHVHCQCLSKLSPGWFLQKSDSRKHLTVLFPFVPRCLFPQGFSSLGYQEQVHVSHLRLELKDKENGWTRQRKLWEKMIRGSSWAVGARFPGGPAGGIAGAPAKPPTQNHVPPSQNSGCLLLITFNLGVPGTTLKEAGAFTWLVSACDHQFIHSLNI